MSKNLINCRYGTPGHESEYVILLSGFHLNNYIPESVSDILQAHFENTMVMNRGSRIEIMTDDPSLAGEVVDVINEIFKQRPWLEDMRR